MSTEETVTEETTKEVPKETHEFNKELQQVQQDRANHQKRSQALEAQTKLQQTQISELREELAKAPVPEEGELDAYEQVAITKNNLASLEKKFNEREIAYKNQEAEINKMNQKADYDESLNKFDKLYGASNRNKSVARVTKLCKDAGYTLEGSDFPSYDSIMIEMEKAYMHEYYLSKEKPPAVKHETDNGIGGTTFNNLDDGIPEGSLDEVIAAMKLQRQ